MTLSPLRSLKKKTLTTHHWHTRVKLSFFVLNFGGEDTQFLGPGCLAFLIWCRECFTACAVIPFESALCYSADWIEKSVTLSQRQINYIISLPIQEVAGSRLQVWSSKKCMIIIICRSQVLLSMVMRKSITWVQDIWTARCHLCSAKFAGVKPKHLAKLSERSVSASSPPLKKILILQGSWTLPPNLTSYQRWTNLCAVFYKQLSDLYCIQRRPLLDLVAAHKQVQPTLAGLRDVLAHAPYKYILLVGGI